MSQRMSGGSTVAGQTAASKIFTILDAFVPDEPGLNLTQLSRRSGLPLATTHRLARELVGWGGLELDEAGTYRIGVRLWEIGSLAPVRGGLRELAIADMEDLYEATHENVQLAVRDGLEALVLEKISGRHSLEIVARVGGRLPLHATGLGKVLLAHAPESVVDAVIEAGLPALTEHTITDPAELRACLEGVRQNGFAWTRDEMTLGSVSIAAPIFGPNELVVAALSIVVRSRVTDVARLSPTVKTAARGLSRRVAASWHRIVPTPGSHEA
jgi:DNA-binding IclR family transcriptional regulator